MPMLQTTIGRAITVGLAALLLTGCATNAPSSAPATALIIRPSAEIDPIPVDVSVRDRVLGSGAAPHVLIIEAALDCATCAVWFDHELPTLLHSSALRSGRLAIRWSETAVSGVSAAAACAGARFWGFGIMVLHHPEWQLLDQAGASALFLDLAVRLGLNGPSFRACLALGDTTAATADVASIKGPLNERSMLFAELDGARLSAPKASDVLAQSGG